MRHSELTRARLSQSHKGSGNPMFGRKHSDETKAKIGAGSRVTNKNRVYVPSPQSVIIPDGVSLGYLAGIIDGEGSIRSSAGRPFVAVYNTSEEIMDWLSSNVGGPLARPSDLRGRVPCFTWRINAALDVYAVCSATLPHLIAKRDDALTTLAFLEEKYGVVMMGG